MREFRLFTGTGKFASIQVEVLGEIRLYRSEGGNRAASPLFSKWYLAPGAGGNRQSPPNSQLLSSANVFYFVVIATLHEHDQSDLACKVRQQHKSHFISC